jgi:lipid-binding SYLF domain-containing protein
MKPVEKKLENMISHPFKLVRGVTKGKDTSKLGKAARALKTESELGPVLHKKVLAALRRMQSTDPSLKDALRGAYGCAVFPHVTKASAVLGGAFGLGEVFVTGQLTGYAALIQATVGLQLGKQTYLELVVLSTPQALEDFKHGKVTLAANAAAVVLKAGAAATTSKAGARIFVQPTGGLGFDASVGGQKFIYKPAAIGRLRSAFEPAKTSLVENLRHFGKATNPNVPPKGGPVVPVRRSGARRRAR